MNRFLKLFLSAFSLAAVSAEAANFTVNMTGFQFAPKDLPVSVGDTVTWVNLDNSFHDTVSGMNRVPSGVWRSQLFGNGGTFSFTFNVSAGRYTYYCTPHVFNFQMVGSITVVAPNAAPSVTVTNPPEGATFIAGENVVVRADASDDNRVARVEFFANGNPIGTDFAAPFSTALTNVSAGNYSLIAIAFDDAGLSATSLVVNISARQPPKIISQPQSQNVVAGSEVTFSVAADGTPPLNFQWQFNGTNISGATNDTLQLRNAQTNDAGNYAVLVSNDVGVIRSALAALVITPLPNLFPIVVLAAPTNGARFRLGSTQTIQANATDQDGTIARVEFFLNTNLVATLSNAPYEIALTNLTLGNYSAVARATDDDGDITISDAVNFSVLASPSVTITQPRDGARFGRGTNISIMAGVNAPGLAATTVQYFETVGNNFVAISPPLAHAPYVFIWGPSFVGTHVVLAIVTDEFGGTNSSAPVSIEVFEPGTKNPTIAITNSPRNFSRLTNSPIFISGTANDDVALERVEFQINGGPFFPASGTKNWVAQIGLGAGTNVFNFRSVDFAGNFSTNATRTLVYVVTSVLSVQVRGLGTISPNLNGRRLEIGKFYQMIARPGSGQIFAGWVGGATSNKTVLNFQMKSNLVLTANFIQNSFPAVKGIYAGTFFETDNLRPESSGQFNLKVTGSGTFSGKLTMQNKSYPLSGQLDYLGRIKMPVLRRPLRPVVITLNLDLSGVAGITGEVTDGEWISELIGGR